MHQDSRWIGRPVPRVEDGRLIRGDGRFIADLNPVPHLAHAAILRSPYAHARIRAVDAEAARQMPGVVGVITGEEAARVLAPFPVGVSAPIRYYPLAVSTVRYVGEPVAVVVAESRYLAEDALDRIRVDYEPLPVVLDLEEAVHRPPAFLHPELQSNVGNHRRFEYGRGEEALRGCELVLRERFVYPRNTAMPIETYGVIASYDPGADEYTVWSNFHGPFTLHTVMSQALRVAPHKLRLITPQDIGGSYGVKSAVYPYIVLIAIASRLLGRPVKWIEDRLEHLKGSSSASERVTYISLGMDRHGKIQALKLEQYDDVGAYLRAPEPATLYRCHGNLTGPYQIENLVVENYAVMTNRLPTGLVRGYGGPQLYFPLERMMDIAARRLRLDPAELRRRNLIPARAFPYRTASGGVYDSGDFQAVLDQALTLAGYADFRAKAGSEPEGVRYGIGIALAVEPSGSNMGYVSLAFTPEERRRQLPKSGTTAAATVAVDALGGVTVRIDSAPEGQGHETVARQIVAEVLTVPWEQIRVVTEVDTATSPWSIASGSYSSRFSAAGAGAIYQAAVRVREKLLTLAASLLGVDRQHCQLRQGTVYYHQTPTTWTLKRLAGMTHWNPLGLPSQVEPGVYETAYYSLPGVPAPDQDDRVNSSALYGFLADVAKVAVDVNTGQVTVLDYVTVHDAGRLLNPLLAEGQIFGGIAFGVGCALYEELVYDQDGQLLTGSLMDYLVPTLAEMPIRIQLAHQQTPSPSSPLGAKGLGEGNVMTAGAAIANAVADALGVEVFTLPLSPRRVLEAIAQGERADEEVGHETPAL